MSALATPGRMTPERPRHTEASRSAYSSSTSERTNASLPASPRGAYGVADFGARLALAGFVNGILQIQNDDVRAGRRRVR